MYRICKVLNHNGVIALDMNDSKEYVLLGKGVGFGKKPGERFEQPCRLYGVFFTGDLFKRRRGGTDQIHPAGIFSDGESDFE